STGAYNGGYALNYGFDRLRLIEPVPVNGRIRAHFSLLGQEEVRPGEVRTKFGVLVEIEGRSRPALVAEWIGLWVTGTGHERIRQEPQHLLTPPSSAPPHRPLPEAERPPRFRLISDYPRHWAGTAPAREAVVFGDRRWTYGELADRVDACARALA